MMVYRIAKCDYINDFSGTGAAMYGGRWNSKGTYILYCASSSSLALLESIVHISSIIKLSLCIACLHLPTSHIKQISESELPEGWQNNPAPFILKDIGDAFIRENKFLALKLPSAIIPMEYNFLINPAHEEFKQVELEFVRKISIDERLIKR